MKTMVAPMRQLKGQASSEAFRSLCMYHTGQRSSLYDETYAGQEAPYPRLMGFYLPPFQRPEVWSLQQKSKFIESVFLGFDIGRLIISSNYTNETDGWLIDGQQRLTAIRDFIENKFSIFNDIFYDDIQAEGFDYSGDMYQIDHGKDGIVRLSPKYHWGTTYFNVLILKDCSVAELKEAYFRLNYGGTPHTAADLRFLHGQ